MTLSGCDSVLTGAVAGASLIGESRESARLPVRSPRLLELEAGYDIRTAQELLGHKDVSTTMIYTHVLNRGPGAVRSPTDSLVAADGAPHGIQSTELLSRYPALPRRLTPPEDA